MYLFFLPGAPGVQAADKLGNATHGQCWCWHVLTAGATLLWVAACLVRCQLLLVAQCYQMQQRWVEWCADSIELATDTFQLGPIGCLLPVACGPLGHCVAGTVSLPCASPGYLVCSTLAVIPLLLQGCLALSGGLGSFRGMVSVLACVSLATCFHSGGIPVPGWCANCKPAVGYTCGRLGCRKLGILRVCACLGHARVL